MKRVSVLGSGAWGTTLAQVLTDAGHDVLIWGRNSEVVEEINTKKTNHSFLGSAILPDSIRATTNVDEAFDFGEAIVLAIPAQSLRENLRNWKSKFPLDKPIHFVLLWQFLFCAILYYSYSFSFVWSSEIM